MSDFDSQGPSDDDWSERGDLAWNEFDWERYLREQDETIQRYLGLYEAYRREADRIDVVADRMGWEPPEATEEPEQPEEEDFEEEGEVYTLHKNPVFIATRAIYLGLRRPWELLAGDVRKVPPTLALAYLGSLHAGEDHAIHAIHALDFGDYAMAVSLFKRALAALNRSLSLLTESPACAKGAAAGAYREDAVPRLFDLREIWLRVIQECRDELGRAVDGES